MTLRCAHRRRPRQASPGRNKSPRWAFEMTVRITGFLSGMNLDRVLHGVGTMVILRRWRRQRALPPWRQMVRGRPVNCFCNWGTGGTCSRLRFDLFGQANPRALADAMRRILEEPDLGASLGATGRQRILLIVLLQGYDRCACAPISRGPRRGKLNAAHTTNSGLHDLTPLSLERHAS